MRIRALRPAALVAVTLLAGGCATPAPSATPTASLPTNATATVRVYLFQDHPRGQRGLVPVDRTVAASDDIAELADAAVAALLAGRNDVEAGASPAITTAIPDGSRIVSPLTIDGAIATVDLSHEFEDGGTPETVASRLAQVVYTITQFPEITGVSFEIDGKPTAVFGPEGFLVNPRAERADFTDQLPTVFVDLPAWASDTGNPMRLTGVANVFEATFHFRLLDSEGRSLADGPVMATCGTGCWGTFDVSVPYVVPASAPGILQVYELSAADGSIQNLTEYPVTLSP